MIKWLDNELLYGYYYVGADGFIYGDGTKEMAEYYRDIVVDYP